MGGRTSGASNSRIDARETIIAGPRGSGHRLGKSNRCVSQNEGDGLELIGGKEPSKEGDDV